MFGLGTFVPSRPERTVAHTQVLAIAERFEEGAVPGRGRDGFRQVRDRRP